MTFTQKADRIVEQAKGLAPKVTTWADFSVAVFGQNDGLIAKAFTEEADRQLFYDSEQYRALSQMRKQLMEKHGVQSGATPEKSGRVLLRIPKSLHQVLEVEAKSEGVSLNQLAVSKLAMPLRDKVDVSVFAVAEAYKRTYDGYSVDRVVVDPDLNCRFLVECRRLGLVESDYSLNHALMDIRKSSKIELPKATKRTEFRDYDEYQFASEIAVRIMQRSKGVSLDAILCDPRLAMEFDGIARQIVPNQQPLKLRWAALNLRKTRRLGPMKATDTDTVNLIDAGPLRIIKPSDLPGDPGVYSFFDQNRPVFAGETASLQHRLELHMTGQMPSWLGMDDSMSCVLKYAPMPTEKQKQREEWLQRFIDHEKPLLNYQRVA